jgi:hypothetical protein
MDLLYDEGVASFKDGRGKNKSAFECALSHR